MMDVMDPNGIGTSDADLDYSKWGAWGNGYQMRPEAQRIIDAYLPGRRTWLNSPSATLNGTPIPPSQNTNAMLTVTRSPALIGALMTALKPPPEMFVLRPLIVSPASLTSIAASVA